MAWRKSFGQLIEIVDLDAVRLHNAGCRLIVFPIVTYKAARFSFRHNRRTGPYQLRAGFLKTPDQLFEVYLVLLQRGRD